MIQSIETIHKNVSNEDELRQILNDIIYWLNDARFSIEQLRQNRVRSEGLKEK